MKRTFVYLLAFVALFLTVAAAAAQEPQVITLNDTTPSVDVVISLPPGNAGVVSLELSRAAVTVTDELGNIAFYMADARVHALELEFAPDMGAHTMTIARLPGAPEAYAMVASKPEMTPPGANVLVNTPLLMLNQAHESVLSGGAPSENLDLFIPAGVTGAVRAVFPDAPVAAQIDDGDGGQIATLYGGKIAGMSIALDGGAYQMTMIDTDLTASTRASVSVETAPPMILAALVADPNQAGVQNVSFQSGVEQAAAAAQTNPCAITINASSINLRSGPGTGYSVLDFGYSGDTYPVGGMNTNGSWLVVGAGQAGSAWMSGGLGELSGDCSNLTVYDTPMRDAPEQQVVYAEPEVIYATPEVITMPGGSSDGGGSGGDDWSSSDSSSDDDDEDEREDEREDEDEDEGEDD